jgi:hypothetical protein
MRVLPEAVWEDHLVPLLRCKDAARLASTCKALRGVVRKYFVGDIGIIDWSTLQAALTTFPRARTAGLEDIREEWGHEEKGALLRWLREEGRGGHLTTMRSWGGTASHFLYSALREGALPSLKGVAINLTDHTGRALLTGGVLGGLHELRLTMDCKPVIVDVEQQLAALGLLRQLPALTKLEVMVYGRDDHPDEVQWPPFIPPTLKALKFYLSFAGIPGRSLLSALPGMLGASGARLERLEICIPPPSEAIDDGLVHVAQALRRCSPTLKDFRLATWAQDVNQDNPDQAERLRVQYADMLAGVSACRELQVLVLSYIMAEPLFPPDTAFARLTHLEISDYERQHSPGAGMMGLWELMASGGLSALAKFSVRLEGRWGGTEEVRSRVAPAFEAVAGILKHLQFEKAKCGGWSSDEVDVGYELGVAVGKLRRLKDLALDLFHDGRAYPAFAQGLAASGGERPLPLLWRVGGFSGLDERAYLLVSLLLSSVRVFHLTCRTKDSRATLLVACAVRQAGYKHTLVLGHTTGVTEGIVRAIFPPCILDSKRFHQYSLGWRARDKTFFYHPSV